MQIDRKKIEKGLTKKGFREDPTHHNYYYFYYKGKESSIYTKTSHGSKYKTYGDELLSQMKKQLQLDNVRELSDLVNCPMSEEQFIGKLKSKGVLITND